jgi:alkaline phosphatase
VIDFDNAVRVAYEFWQKHPEDTLIVVTGDHETGGLTLGFAGTGYTSYIENLGAQKYSREGMRLRFAAQKDPDFEKMKPLITKAVGLVFDKTDQARAGNLILSENDEAALRDKFNQHVKEGEFRGPNALSGEAIRILNNKSAVAWTSGAHTALPVSTTAVGAESDLFSNMLDNTDISKRLKLVVR